MFGISDPWIWGGYIFAFAMVIACAIYGWIKRDDENEGGV